MTALDTKFVPLAKQLIDKYGKRMSVVRNVAGTYDTATGESPITSTTLTINGVFRGPTKEQIKGGALSTDAMITFASTDFTVEPLVGDSVVISGETWKVVATFNKYSGNNVCIYTLQVRK